MHPSKVDRARLARLTDLPNIGPAGAKDLQILGIQTPADLTGKDAFELHQRLCALTGVRHDPCVIDVFLSVTSFMDGGPPLPWWSFTEQRKRTLDGPTDQPA